MPHVSAFQEACSRLGWALEEAHPLTAHGRPVAALRRHFQPGRRLLVLTSDGAGPAAIARCLAEDGYGASRIIVLEDLGGPERAPRRRRPHRISTAASPTSISSPSTSPRREQPRPCVPGLPDEAFEHDGQLTKAEVRAVTLAALAPCDGELLWDVGAGAGSVAIEWLRAGRGMRAIAIERDPARAARIAANAERLGVPELVVHTGAAPGRPGRAAGTRRDLHRRWHRRARSARPLLEPPRPRRPPGRQRRLRRRRSGTPGLPATPWRRAGPSAARPRRDRGHPAGLAPRHARHPARGAQADAPRPADRARRRPGRPRADDGQGRQGAGVGARDRVHRRGRPRQPLARDRGPLSPLRHARADRGHADDPGPGGHRPRLQPARDRHRQRARPGPRRRLPVRGRPAALRLLRPPAAAARQPVRVRRDPRHHLDHRRCGRRPDPPRAPGRADRADPRHRRPPSASRRCCSRATASW